MIFYDGKVLASMRENFLRTSEDDDDVPDLASLVRNFTYKFFNLSRVFVVFGDDLRIPRLLVGVDFL